MMLRIRRGSCDHFTVLASVFLGLCWIQPLFAEAKTAQFQQSVSGAFVPSTFDTNLDGNTGVLYQAGADGTFGKSDYEGLIEAVVLPVPKNCKPGQTERRVLVFSIVQRFENGDLLFSQLAEDGGISCATPGERIPFRVAVDITGGTGRFEGARGQYIFTASSVLLLQDPDGINVLHAARFGKIEGTIELR